MELKDKDERLSQAMSVIDKQIDEKTALKLTALSDTIAAQYATKGDFEKTQALHDNILALQKELEASKVSVSDIAEKHLQLTALIQGMNKSEHMQGLQKSEVDSLQLSQKDALSIYAHNNLHAENFKLPESLTQAQYQDIKDYDDVTRAIYSDDPNTAHQAYIKFCSKPARGQFTLDGQQQVNQELLQSARAYMQNPSLNLAIVGGGSYIDPQLLTDFGSCLTEPTNLLGEFGYRDITSLDYDFFQQIRHYSPAKFISTEACEGVKSSDIGFKKPIKRRAKPMSSIACFHREELKAYKKINLDSMIRKKMVQDIVDGLNEDSMFGNGANIDNWLNSITSATVTGASAGQYITWQGVGAARDRLEITDKRNVKIYTSASGSSYLSGMTDANGQPISTIKYINGKLTVGLMEVYEINRSFHTPGYGYANGALQGMKPNYVVGDLKQLASLMMYISPTVTRYSGGVSGIGSLCDAFVSLCYVDFAIDCQKAAIKLISP